MPKPKFKGFYNRDNNAQQKSEFGRGKRLHAYRKTFTSIHDGIKEIIETVPKIRTRVFGEYVPSPSVEDETVIRNVVDICKGVMDQDFPLISSDDYPNTYTMTLRGDAFFFRTKDAVSFSWEYDHRALFDGEISIIFSLIFNEPRNPLMYKSFKAVIDALVEKGWAKYDLDAPREYRSRRSNQVRQQNNQKAAEDSSSMYQIGNNANVIIGGVAGNYDDLKKHYYNNPDDLKVFNPCQTKPGAIDMKNFQNDETYINDWTNKPPETNDVPTFDFKGIDMSNINMNTSSGIEDTATISIYKEAEISAGSGVSIDLEAVPNTSVTEATVSEEAEVDTSVTEEAAMEEPSDPVDAAESVVETQTE